MLWKAEQLKQKQLLESEQLKQKQLLEAEQQMYVELFQGGDGIELTPIEEESESQSEPSQQGLISPKYVAGFRRTGQNFKARKPSYDIEAREEKAKLELL